jgi:hypothetical protein
MPRTATTPIDPIEREWITFDFGPGVSTGVQIDQIVSFTCKAVVGVDAAAQSRVIGAPSLVASPTTGAALAAVKQLVGSMVAGVTYQLQCVVAASDKQVLSWRWNLPCAQPPGT